MNYSHEPRHSRYFEHGPGTSHGSQQFVSSDQPSASSSLYNVGDSGIDEYLDNVLSTFNLKMGSSHDDIGQGVVGVELEGGQFASRHNSRGGAWCCCCSAGGSSRIQIIKL